MRTVFDNAAAFDSDNAIGVTDRRQPVGNNEDGPAGGDLLHVLLDRALAFVIERARCLVKNQNARIQHQRAGDRNALPLSSGQAAATLTNNRVVAVGQLQNEIMGTCELGRGNDSLPLAPPDPPGQCSQPPNN